MFCSKCGTTVAEGVAFCPNCGQATGGVAAAAATPAYAGSPAYSAPAAAPRVAYAGFWLRFVAIIIDFIALAIVTFPIRLALFGMFGIHRAMRPPFGERPEPDARYFSARLDILGRNQFCDQPPLFLLL